MSTNRSDLVVARSGHGLTAETVVVALEDIEDYQAFEATIIADYDARTAVEREQVFRLASLLWRMRRATAVETDLLQIQAEILSDRQYEYETGDDTGQKPQRASPTAFSSEQLVRTYAETQGMDQVMLTRATPSIINVSPFGLPAMIQVAYRGA